MVSIYAPASFIRVVISSVVHAVSSPFTRTETDLPAPRQSCDFKASIARWRASTLALGATESSRSRNTASASDMAALAIIFAEDAGLDSKHRRNRALGAGIERCDIK